MELEPQGAPNQTHEREALRDRWRSARRTAVETRARALAAAHATDGKDASILARLTKRVLQNLEVQVLSAKIVLHDNQESKYPPVQLSASLFFQTIDKDSLDSAALPDQVVTAPGNADEDSERTLYKRFSLGEIEVCLGGGKPILGPVSLTADLAHDVTSKVVRSFYPTPPHPPTPLPS